MARLWQQPHEHIIECRRVIFRPRQTIFYCFFEQVMMSSTDVNGEFKYCVKYLWCLVHSLLGALPLLSLYTFCALMYFFRFGNVKLTFIWSRLVYVWWCLVTVWWRHFDIWWRLVEVGCVLIKIDCALFLFPCSLIVVSLVR